MGIEENKKVIKLLYKEAWGKGNYDILAELISPNSVYVNPHGEEFIGPKGREKSITAVREKYPGLRVTIDTMVAEGDMVAVHSTWYGTFRGKEISSPCAVFHRFEDGKVLDVVEFMDMLKLYQQMGITPPMPEKNKGE